VEEGRGDGAGQRQRPSRTLGEENGEGDGFCSVLITIISVFLIIITFPISLFMSIKVVQEYERAVIFRLGRIKKGGAQGPGLFFIIPCIDQCVVVDLRWKISYQSNIQRAVRTSVFRLGEGR
jgi:regulator of protease activity HflC (stomatin/prohibitin superfamily)